jgi:hypothetical protein
MLDTYYSKEKSADPLIYTGKLWATTFGAMPK